MTQYCSRQEQIIGEADGIFVYLPLPPMEGPLVDEIMHALVSADKYRIVCAELMILGSPFFLESL